MNNYCYTCRFFVGRKDVGICRRFPPQGAVWAEVAADDWCGEHKLLVDERRLDAPASGLVDRVTSRTYGGR